MKLLKTIVVLLAGTTLTTATALAQQVGTATAVNPESRTTPPGGSTVVLKVGAHVMHKERIKTTPTGSVQLLFLDRSTLTIAPNSDRAVHFAALERAARAARRGLWGACAARPQ